MQNKILTSYPSKQSSYPSTSSSSLSFLLTLTVNPNSYPPGSDTIVETKPCVAADTAVYTIQP